MIGYAVWSDDETAEECAMVHFGSSTDPTDKSIIRVGVTSSAPTAEVAETWKEVAEVLLAEGQGPSDTQLTTAGKTVSVFVPYSWTTQSLRDPAFLQQVCDTLRQVRSAFSSVTGLRP